MSTVSDAHITEGGVVEGGTAEVSIVPQDLVYLILVDYAFEVPYDEAGKEPADLRILVREDILNV